MNTGLGILGTALLYTVVIGVLCLDAAIVCAASRYVVLLDLSKSVAEEFPRYVCAIEHLLGQMQPGSTVTVVGIAENSFGNPRLLLHERLADPEGPPDKLKPNDCKPLASRPIHHAKCESENARKKQENARKKQEWDALLDEHRKKEKDKILSLWRQHDSLRPDSETTDVLGALKYAERLLESNGMGSKVLCILSDMRHDTKHLNLEKRAVVRLQVLDDVKDRPRLDGVSIRICGVHTRSKTPEYWESLREFWTHFLQDTGGQLDEFRVDIHPCCETQR